jgi:hypothetical protein
LKNQIFLKIQYFPSQLCVIWKKNKFQNFSISENNIINVEVAKVVGKLGLFVVLYVFQVFSSDGGSCIETIMGTWFAISC